MIGIFKKINRLLYESIEWFPVDGNDRNFITSKYNPEECWLRMNDFPDEPLWTLFFKGEEKDIEDTPNSWKVNYRSE
jgi:hypothetical protein